MSLSVCTFTSAPGPFVATALGRLRDVADEIVVVADATVPDRDLREYARVADRLFRADFEFLEFHLPWLHRQCRGDWVLRLDGDECVSDALVQQLPDLIASREALQYWIPRRWVYPDTGHWIAELPWWPDPQLRLVRNDGTLSFDGALHSSARPASPHGYVEAPIYHLAALVDPLEARWRRTQRYEALRPELQAPGGGPMAAYYLPERFASCPPRPVPPEDAAHLREALAAGHSAPSEEATTAAAGATWVGRREFERCWPLRSVGAAARRARLEVFDPEVQLERMSAGEIRLVLVRATNAGDEEWPGGADGSPPVRIGIRWRSADGALLSDDQRGVLSRAIAAGSTRLVGILVQAPAEPGDCELGLDVLVEGGGWFGCEVRHEVRVAPAHERVILEINAALPPERRGFRRLRSRRVKIPRVVHQIWLGPEELPDEFAAYRQTWAVRNPGWEQRLWTDESVGRELPDLQLERARNWAERSDLVRYEILRRFGGIYADTDFECLRPFDSLLPGVTAFAGLEVPGRVCNALIGAVPGHPAFEMAARRAQELAGIGVYPYSTGPQFLTYVLAQHPDVTIFPPEAFYPYLWTEPDRKGERFPAAYAVHHWAHTWSQASAGRHSA